MTTEMRVPQKEETVAVIRAHLAQLGYGRAVFCGHSFGSIPAAWMVRSAPELCAGAVFLDPVCFLLYLPDICFNFVYRPPTTWSEWWLQIIAARELYVANVLMRNFWWYHNYLSAAPLDDPSGTGHLPLNLPVFVQLGGVDDIIPAPQVKRSLSSSVSLFALNSTRTRPSGEALPGESRSYEEEAPPRRPVRAKGSRH